ncbi:hypothetical protein HUZ36_02615 [Pseudoalteromonas sp. McH1-7]|uniref:hypothetical protein n=1 Tax=unclassified Pseudoalteromonas TaxID=194690 RepID=UPI001591E5CC|nr:MULTISPECIES: hypothetical protein [unclassified Pseudoalteromonas]NUZ09666.1 hypothetical protein [Pseudoalteromonas sp. McH1-7]USD27724.1 hypothetical protein J8Z24_12320 [Pseudoalteromonas sp. SCSIO 43201]
MSNSLSLKDWIDLLEKNHDKVVTLWTMYLTFVVAISAGVISSGEKLNTSGKYLVSISFLIFTIIHLVELMRRYKAMNIISIEIKSISESDESLLDSSKNWLTNINVVSPSIVFGISIVSTLLVMILINYLPSTIGT